MSLVCCFSGSDCPGDLISSGCSYTSNLGRNQRYFWAVSLPDPAKVVCLFYPAALACWIVVKFGFSAGTQVR